MDNKVHAFSYLAPENHRHAIVFDIGIGVSLPIPNAPKDLKGRVTVRALIDTGASGSAISERFAQSVKLSSYRRMIVHAANGDSIVPVYTVDVSITNANNQTMFSFRMPPDEQHIDYTKS